MVCALLIGTIHTNTAFASTSDGNDKIITASSEKADNNIVQNINSEKNSTKLNKILEECKKVNTDLNVARVSRCTLKSIEGNKANFDINIDLLASGIITIEGETTNGLKSSFKCRSNYFAAGIDTNKFHHFVSAFYSGECINSSNKDYNKYNK